MTLTIVPLPASACIRSPMRPNKLRLPNYGSNHMSVSWPSYIARLIDCFKKPLYFKTHLKVTESLLLNLYVQKLFSFRYLFLIHSAYIELSSMNFHVSLILATSLSVLNERYPTLPSSCGRHNWSHERDVMHLNSIKLLENCLCF